MTSYTEAAKSQGYGYDGFGNLWQTAASGVPALAPNGSAWYLQSGSGVVNNRYNGVQYTDAGDVKQYSLSGGPWEQVYDGEGRLLRVEQAGGTKMVEYDYDAEGRRVRRVAGAVTTHFAYDAGGQLMGEYGGPVAATGRQYLVADHLGSTRMVVSGGVCVNRFDYAPFGGEVDRAGEPCYGSSAEPRQKFTGKERDTETGLDYFNVRYMSSAQGRFTSPDPLVWQSWQSGNEDEQARFHQFIGNPLNFNLYTYGLNNPLKYNDPTGLDVELAVNFVGDISDEEKRRILTSVRGYLENLKVGKVVVRDTADSAQDKRTFRQKLKDSFAVDYHSITVDLAHPNPWGNNADKPNFVKAFNMARMGDPRDYFGDLRQSDPTQWSNIIGWRILHESISHAFGIGPDDDQLVQVGGSRAGTLIQGSYGRGKPGIPPLNPADTRAIQQLLLPRSRSYGR